MIVRLGYVSETKVIEAGLQAMAVLRPSAIGATLIWVGQSHADIAFWHRRAAALVGWATVKFLDSFIDDAA